MKERRKVTRKNLMAYTQVFDLYGVYLIGYLGDLTLQGAMVIGEKQIKENEEMTLAIELPELPDIAASRNVGFEFKEVSPDQQTIIESIIDNYEFRRDIPDYRYPPSTGK